MAFTTSPVPMDLASLRLRALQRDMSAAATDAAATVFTAAPVMEALRGFRLEADAAYGDGPKE